MKAVVEVDGIFALAPPPPSSELENDEAACGLDPLHPLPHSLSNSSYSSGKNNDTAVASHSSGFSPVSLCSGRGIESSLGISATPISHPLAEADLLCLLSILTRVLSKIIFVMASPSSVSIASVDVVTGGVLSPPCCHLS